MLDARTQPNPNPRMASLPIGALLTHFADTLPWLTDRYGLAQVGIDKNSKERYPQIYRQDGSRQVTDIRPDEKMKALCWFDRYGPSLFEGDESLGLSGSWRHQLEVYVWLNMPLLAERGYDFSEEVIEDFVGRGLLDSPLGADLSIERVEQRPEAVFERYRWQVSTNQLLMYPFAAFRIQFEVLQYFTRGCKLPFGQGTDVFAGGFNYLSTFVLA